jgi:hypothetical protein
MPGSLLITPQGAPPKRPAEQDDLCGYQHLDAKYWLGKYSAGRMWPGWSAAWVRDPPVGAAMPITPSLGLGAHEPVIWVAARQVRRTTRALSDRREVCAGIVRVRGLSPLPNMAPARSDVCAATSREELTTRRLARRAAVLMPPEWSNHDTTRAPHRLRRSSAPEEGILVTLFIRPECCAVPGLPLACPGRHDCPGRESVHRQPVQLVDTHEARRAAHSRQAGHLGGRHQPGDTTSIFESCTPEALAGATVPARARGPGQ